MTTNYFTDAQRQVIKGFRSFLLDAGMDKLFASGGGAEEPTDARSFHVPGGSESLSAVARLFGSGEMVAGSLLEREAPPELLLLLEAHGLARRNGEGVHAGDYRLVCHLGLFLFCQRVSATAKFYYGNDSLALSRRLLPAEGRVLDLCAGVGTQALVCAQTADSVTAVEIEPLAEPIFRINAELNGLSGKVEFLIGNLLEPVSGRQFDRICCNPPFMPAPPGLPYPLFAGGGPDGLSVVRRLLAALPDVLAPEGQCHIVGAVLGNAERPEVSLFEKLAVDARLRLELDCRTCEALEGSAMAAIAGTAFLGEAEAAEIFRNHFTALGATHLYCFLLRATRAARPSLYLSHHGGQTATVWN